MVVVILIAVAALVVALGAFVALRVSGRSGASGPLAGEPTPPSTPTATTDTVPTPTVEELEELLRAPAAEVDEPSPAAPETIERPRLRDRLGGTRKAFSGAFGRIRGRKIDDETWDELEESLLLADVGMVTTTRLLDGVRTRAKEQSATEPDELIALLRDEVVELLSDDADRSLHLAAGEQNVWMFVGVNGVGKTTTIGKLASKLREHDRTVILAAADTFRAAAEEQLEIWAERAGADFVGSERGGDPAAVAFDAVEAAEARGRDVVIVDTAGRLHTQVNLMEELAKVRRVIERKLAGAPHETLLVVDATTGQNGLQQARLFGESAGVTGVALTKLDGSAKGGVAVAIAYELGLPVKLIGVGERLDDLRPFDAQDFARALVSA
jgi:fused signal recognition particle receptor